MTKMNKYFESTILVAISLNTISILIYIFYFRTGFTMGSLEWSNFGQFLSGVSGYFNIIILITITFLIKNIETGQKRRELEHQLDLAFFNRYFEAYENMIQEVINLNMFLHDEGLNIKTEQSIKYLLESFKQINLYHTLLMGYGLDGKNLFNYDGIKTCFANLIGALEQKKSDEIIFVNKNALLKIINQSISGLNTETIKLKSIILSQNE